jgi:hypothetical protein
LALLLLLLLLLLMLPWAMRKRLLQDDVAAPYELGTPSLPRPWPG